MVRHTPLGLAAIVAAGLFCLPSGAFAHWQYTRWGMPEQEVIAASKGAVVPSAGQAELMGTYEAGGRTFTAKFRFDAGKLALVNLIPNADTDCRALLTDMKSAYGEPVDVKTETLPQWLWDDSKNGNRVMFTKVFETCALQYRPLSTNKSGL